MTNEQVMQIMTELGLHEGGLENWVYDNAWVKVVNRALAEQAEQEPIAIIEKEAGFETEVYATGHADSLPDGVFKLYAAPVQQVEQEPVADVVVRPLRGDQSQPTIDIKWLQRPTTGKLYASPVRTKDLTDAEIATLVQRNTIDGKIMPFALCEAVIAADRELNK